MYKSKYTFYDMCQIINCRHEVVTYYSEYEQADSLLKCPVWNSTTVFFVFALLKSIRLTTLGANTK